MVDDPNVSRGRSVPAGADQAAADRGGPGGALVVVSPVVGTVVTVAAPGSTVAQGDRVAVVESMKMEYPVIAPRAGVVDRVLVEPGRAVERGGPLLRLGSPAPAATVAGARGVPPDPQQAPTAGSAARAEGTDLRPELAEWQARRALLEDAARPEAVARHHRIGHRTARENVADLLDPGSFHEYGGFAVAAQRGRRSEEELRRTTPADGLVAGIGRIGGDRFPDAADCVVLAYDYTVLAGTQGVVNHRKKDRMLELAGRRHLPVVLFAEGGGGRPGDTDALTVTGLDTQAFALFGGLSGRVPLVGIVAGRCFAGNAALLGCCDVVIATEDASIGMGGPAMIEGGGLGVVDPDEIGPSAVHATTGVVDVVVADEAEAVAVARRYLGFLQGSVAQWSVADQHQLRTVLPERRSEVYDPRRLLDLVADTGSVLELRRSNGPAVVTALARIEGRPVGILANDPQHNAGAIDAPAAAKAARFVALCDAFDLPLVSLVDTPGFMVGPDAEAAGLVRQAARLFTVGARVTVPWCAVVVRKAYGLGAQAMAGGSLHAPERTVAWPTGELGGMGLEGAVRLGFRRELAAVTDPGERQVLEERLIAAAYARGRALEVAAVFELDDVIDPAETRRTVLAALTAGGAWSDDRPGRGRRGWPGGKRPGLDVW
jgi:acetyl-CoA carboxylase carboxyltransferase component